MAWAIRDKRCVITGANSGIGKQTALALARDGAQVVIVCRDAARGEAARDEIRRASGNDRVDLMLCDMASLRAIRDFTAEFRVRFDRLDVLVNNAGAMFSSRGTTDDGFELHFGVNHLGYFAVTAGLLPLLRASAPARIISVASAGHRLARLDFDDLQGERFYQRFIAYGNSKLCNIMFTYELARRLAGTGVTANCLHPGAVGSNFGQSAGPLFSTFMKLGKPLLVSAEDGARTPIYLARSAEVDGVTGEYFIKCKPARSSGRSHDRDAQRRLWEISEQLVGA